MGATPMRHTFVLRAELTDQEKEVLGKAIATREPSSGNTALMAWGKGCKDVGSEQPLHQERLADFN
jgi:hypothetical protein